MKKPAVYILKSNQSDRYYVGSTSDIARRLKQHRSNQTHTTARMGELQMVFYQELSSLKGARAAEKRIKSWKRRDFIEKIVKEGRITFLD